MKLSNDKKKTAPRTLPKQHVLDPRKLSEHVDSVPEENVSRRDRSSEQRGEVEPYGSGPGADDENPQEIATNSDIAFLILMAKDAGLQRKDFQYGMKVSKELVKMWFEGKRRNPLKSARDCVALFPARLVPTLLEYLAGSNFDGAILDARIASGNHCGAAPMTHARTYKRARRLRITPRESQRALIVLAKVVTK